MKPGSAALVDGTIRVRIIRYLPETDEYAVDAGHASFVATVERVVAVA